MISAVRAEWTKLRTVAGPMWLLAVMVIATVGVGASASASAVCVVAGCGLDPVRISLTGVLVGQAVVAVFGVLAMGAEYSSGMMGTTLAAVPHRGVVLIAKAVTILPPIVLAGCVGVVGSVLAGRILLPGGGFTLDNGFPPVSLTDPATLRAAAGTVLYLALIGLLSVGVATIVRSSTAAVGIVLGVLYLFPLLISVITDPDWQRNLKRISPGTSGLVIQSTVAADLPIGPWAGQLVCAAWAVGALLVGGLLLRLRDA